MFAAGHGPREVAEWTWDQVGLVARAVQMYHLDLAARLVTGKSAVAEGSGGVRADRQWMHQDPDRISDEEKQRIAQAELAELARFAGGPAGAGVNLLGGAGTIAVKITAG